MDFSKVELELLQKAKMYKKKIVLPLLLQPMANTMAAVIVSLLYLICRMDYWILF